MQTKPRVLFVDDEPNVLEGITDALRRTRFEVVTAVGGREGLRKLAESRFSIVISDFRMPGMNGAEFLAHSRTVAPDAIRMLLTGEASLHDAVAAVNDGKIFRFLAKPCKPRELVAALDDAMEQVRLVTADRELLEGKLATMAGHLIRAERMASLGTMAGAIGHELNNMLAVFGGALEFMREDLAAGRAPAEEDLKSLDHVRQHLKKHATNLLELGRPRAATVEPTDLTKVVRDVVDMMRTSGALKYVEITVEIPEVSVIIDADRTETEQVLVNLIKNAIDAAVEARRLDQRRPHVAIGLATGAVVSCTVRDNGIGIPADHLERVFEPYFTTKDVDRGTGLGLFVTRQIIERHRGRIAVASETRVGTTFTIELPLRQICQR